MGTAGMQDQKKSSESKGVLTERSMHSLWGTFAIGNRSTSATTWGEDTPLNRA